MRLRYRARYRGRGEELGEVSAEESGDLVRYRAWKRVISRGIG